MQQILYEKSNYLYFILFFLAFTLLFTGCHEKDSVDTEAMVPFDPNAPVSVNDFIPTFGGGGQQIVIHGKNFGIDTSLVNVYIGGKRAILISVNNENIYCLVPDGAYDGDIEIEVGKDGNKRTAKADENFEYQRKLVVSTLMGETNERREYDVKDGPFDDCGGFSNPTWLEYDPADSNMLYMGQDGGDIRLINFGDSTVSTPIRRGDGGWDRIRTISFTMDGQHMIIANDQGNVNGISTSILSRSGGFKDPQILTSFRQCNGAAIHPFNGELYFNSYEKGQFFRFDLNGYLNGENLKEKDYKELFKIQDNSWEFNIRIHPSGDYAYIVVINQHYILRTDYNWDQKTFMPPYLVVGAPREAGWNDGVGANVRLNGPYQGVFVKNPEYEGRRDEYDFYFTEQYNHDIRILTPEGKVTTFAGRGSSSINSDPWGYVDGDLRKEARFDRPKGLAYDSREKVFYVGDGENHIIRKIGFEGGE